MPRKLKEWVGAHDDAAIPPRVQLRVLERSGNRCAECHRLLGPAGEKFEIDHIRALANGGEHRETNLQALCVEHHKAKTRKDVAIKSRAYEKRLKNAGLGKSKWRPLPGTKASGIRKRMDGTVEKWT